MYSLIQIQNGSQHLRWDETLVILEYKQFAPCLIKIPGSNRLTMKNSCLLRSYEPPGCLGKQLFIAPPLGEPNLNKGAGNHVEDALDVHVLSPWQNQVEDFSDNRNTSPTFFQQDDSDFIVPRVLSDLPTVASIPFYQRRIQDCVTGKDLNKL